MTAGLNKAPREVKRVIILLQVAGQKVGHCNQAMPLGGLMCKSQLGHLFNCFFQWLGISPYKQSTFWVSSPQNSLTFTTTICHLGKTAWTEA